MEHEHSRLLEQGVAAVGLRLDPGQLIALGRHVDLLLKWNKSINLTAITDPAEVVEKHVIDSLAVAPLLPAGSLLDAGSGGGFPGLCVAIARADIEVVMVDSVQKKVAFLKSVLAELRIPRLRALAVRLQGNPGAEGLVRVNAAVARAFSSPEEWLTLAQHYLLPGGVALCMLGPADSTPERVGEMDHHRELAYRLPFSNAQRRIAIYRRRG